MIQSYVHKALLCENILNNLIPLSVLNLLKDEIEKIKNEEFNQFQNLIKLFTKIKNQPVHI